MQNYYPDPRLVRLGEAMGGLKDGKYGPDPLPIEVAVSCALPAIHRLVQRWGLYEKSQGPVMTFAALINPAQLASYVRQDIVELASKTKYAYTKAAQGYGPASERRTHYYISQSLNVKQQVHPTTFHVGAIDIDGILFRSVFPSASAGAFGGDADTSLNPLPEVSQASLPKMLLYLGAVGLGLWLVFKRK